MAHDIQRPGLPRTTRSIALTALCTVGAAGLLAACSSTSGTTTSGGSGGSTGSAATVSTRQLANVGTVLVDQSGKTVYSPDQEAGGTIKCTGECLSFWFPVTVNSSATPSMPTGLTGTVGTIRRPDNGQTQVTYNGKPLYTFRLDQAPGQDHGENYQDSFNGITFTWHAVNSAGTQAGGAGASTPNPNGTSGYGTGY